MKIYFPVFILSILIFTACVDYLEKTPESDVTSEDVFGTYPSFQGFVDNMYPHIQSAFGWHYGWNMNWGGSVWNTHGTHTIILKGDYWWAINASMSGLGNGVTREGREYGSDIEGRGIWTGGWNCVRKANIALEKLPLLVDATEEERRLIEGQAYFFRAYFHGEILRVWGGMPYIDRVLQPSDNMKLDRLSYHETVERVVEDLDRAIDLLPENWDDTGPGSKRRGANHGRITKGAALGYKQRHLLYAASPLMNGTSGNSYTYNVDYAKRSAEAGWELIKLADKGVYSLVPMSKISGNFYTQDRTTVWTSETILARARVYGIGINTIYCLDQNFVLIPLVEDGIGQTINQTFVDKFEMADGTRYKIEYDWDNEKRWKNRDPRFHAWIAVDREKMGDHPEAYYRFYIGNDTYCRPQSQAVLPYAVKKYVGWNMNDFDDDWWNAGALVPNMRLAEAYLSYAEAVTVAYGPNGSAPGANISAVDAINIVRERAGMPPVTADATGYNSFMDLVWNERSVELCFESHYWYDRRRWYNRHLEDGDKDFVDLQFDKDYTYFTRKTVEKLVFDIKHYWMPISRDQTMIYKGFYQNPGW